MLNEHSKYISLFGLLHIIFFTSVIGQNTWVVNSTSYDGICDIVDCTFKEAISIASNGDTIIFQGVSTIATSFPHQEIDKDLFILGPGTDSLVISGGTFAGGSRIIYVKQGSKVHIEGLTLEDGKGINFASPLIGGGAIYNEGTLSLKDVVFKSNQNHTIVNTGSLNLENCTIKDGTILSTLPVGGDGIHNLGNLYALNCTISDNEEIGIYHTGSGTADIINCLISGNGAGGVYTAANIVIDSCMIIGNTGAIKGGGLIVDSADAVISNSQINENLASDFGGGVYISGDGNAVFNGCSILGNQTTDPSPSGGGPFINGGGGLYNNGITMLIGCTVAANEIPSQFANATDIVNLQAELDLINCTVSQMVGGASLTKKAITYVSTSQAASGMIISCTINAINAMSINSQNPIRNSLIIGDIAGITNSLGNNIFQDTTNSNMLLHPTDLIGPSVANIADFLAPLQDNGGPTFTHALLKDSLGNNPAIDKISMSGTGTPLTDQRGLARLGFADIGAFEYHKTDVIAPVKVFCIGEDYDPLDDLIISDSFGGGLQVGEDLTFILAMPEGFSLNPGIGVVESIGSGINIRSYSILANTIFINYDRYFEAALNQIIIRDLEVKASEVSNGADILRLGGNALQRENAVSDSVSHGRLIALGSVPIAGFSWKNDCLGDSIQFQDESIISDGSLAYWNWAFDVGNTSVVQNPSYAYGDTGIYEVSLIVGPDSICTDTIIQRVPVFANVVLTPVDPYLETFENGPAGWVVDGQNPSWQWGEPNGSTISEAGNRAWITDLSDTYNLLENSWLDGPCLDISGLDRPMISLDIWSDTEAGFDGAVMQVSADGGESWENLGDFNDPQSSGINWYNGLLVAGDPVFATGWTGQLHQNWVNARHKLDHLKDAGLIRIRIAFGSNESQPIGSSLDGFAFDNVWVGNRSKNIAIEHFANTSSAGMESANDTIYRRAQQNPLDIIPLQYHTGFPGPDEFYAFNPSVSNTRSYYYKINEPQQVVVSGSDYNGSSILLDQNTLDLSMLRDAKYDIDIGAITFINPTTIEIGVAISALDTISVGDVVGHVILLEKKVDNNGQELKYVVRAMLPNAGGALYGGNWSINRTETLNYIWTIPPGVVLDQLQVVALMQNYLTGEIYQSAKRDVIEMTTDLGKVFAGNQIRIYPNPASDRLYVEIMRESAELDAWAIYDARGIKHLSGKLDRMIDQFDIPTVDLANGLYILTLQNSQGLLTRNKIIVRH